MAEKSAGSEQEKPRHAHWDKVVSAAYLRILGHTQVEAATAVGRNERTIREWEADTALWEAARGEARSRWLSDAEDAARLAVLNSIKMGNAELGKWLLERTEPKLAPPKQQSVVSGSLTLKGLDMSRLTDEQVARIAAGEDPFVVLATTMPNPT